MEENNLLQSGVLTLHLKKSFVLYHKGRYIYILQFYFLFLSMTFLKLKKNYNSFSRWYNTMQLSSKSLQDLYDLANFELSKIEDWIKANKNKKGRCKYCSNLEDYIYLYTVHIYIYVYWNTYRYIWWYHIKPRLGFKKSINVNPSNRELSAQRTKKRKRYIHIYIPF